jgi:AGZA family xanthine/uracil permease-like MFS transporter
MNMGHGRERDYYEKEGSMLRRTMEKYFDLQGHKTTVKHEMLAGVTSFFTIVYIVAVNAAILSDAGILLEAGILTTVLTSFVGCLLMELWGNAPIVLVPGMGVNAFFSYTIVQSMGLSWQEALGAVFVSGMIFTLTAFPYRCIYSRYRNCRQHNRPTYIQMVRCP